MYTHTHTRIRKYVMVGADLPPPGTNRVIGGRRPGATDNVNRSGEVHVDPDVAVVQAEIGVPDAVLGRGQAGIVPEHHL